METSVAGDREARDSFWSHPQPRRAGAMDREERSVSTARPFLTDVVRRHYFMSLLAELGR